MNLKQKSLVVCALLFLVILGVLLITKVKMFSTNNTNESAIEPDQGTNPVSLSPDNRATLSVPAGGLENSGTASNNNATTALVLGPGSPLKETYDELINRASSGDQKAACSLEKQLEACRRYAIFITGDGKLGPYEKANTKAEIDALDAKLFGMPMERVSAICAGFDARGRERKPSAALRTSRSIRDHTIATHAVLQLQYFGYDPENLKTLFSRAQAGDALAVRVLALEPEQPSTQFDSKAEDRSNLYGKVDINTRKINSIKWLLILQHIESDARTKAAIDKKLEDYYLLLNSHKNGPSIDINKTRREAERIFSESYKENQLGGHTDRLIFDLSDDFCEE